MGVRTLDISEYEDSREYPKYRPAEREYRPEHFSADRYEYSPEAPPPDRYEDSREFGPEYPREFGPQYPSRDRL